jgi:serine/threonine protein kinase/cytochrome c-type biogenesis protein CcmH/NrfG
MPVPNPVPPAIVPDYELIRRIGSGAYGEVWLARSKATGAFRAAKIVWRHAFEDDRPFRREFEGIKRFEQISREHPSQLALFHIGRNDEAGYFYYLMELADNANAEGGTTNSKAMLSRPSDRGEVGSWHLETIDAVDYSPHTLRAELAHGRLSAARTLEIAQALAEALSHLHRHGLVHRDVKPSNVIFVNGRPKLADIGLVTDASDQCSIVGTEGYLPPEGTGTPQADIFALGKVLYETATGLDRRRFPELPEDLRQWPERSEVMEFNEIVLKACAKDLAQRYQSAEEMQADLALLQSGKSVKGRRASRRRWKLSRNIALGATVFALVGSSLLFALRELNPNRPLSSDPEATNLYQDAGYLEQRGTLEGTLQAITNLIQAVTLAPRFVDAYFRCFEIYTGTWGDQLPPYKDTMANFRWVADKLRPLNSARYHTVNAYLKFQEWHLDEAIDEIKLAVSLDPKFGRAHGLYAWMILRARGDTETAHREFKAAERIGGSDVINQMHLGTPYYVERNYSKAIEQYEKALRLEPRSDDARWLLGQTYEADNQYGKALDAYEAMEKERHGNVAKIEAKYNRYRSILTEKGPREMWQARLDDLRQNSWHGFYDMAGLCARLDYTNEVFDLLEKARQEHEVDMINLLIDECWDPLRKDRRYIDLLKKMGFAKVVAGRK